MELEVTTETLRLLVVGPPAFSAKVRALTGASTDTTYVLEQTESQDDAAKRCAEERPDCVLVLDFGQAPSSETVLARVAEETGHVPVPVVVLTDADNERRVSQTLKIGAQDCLLIDQVDPTSLERSIRHAVARKRIEERLVRSALYDQLTGLPNRTVFFDRLHVAIQRARRTLGFRFAVAFLDLDHFKAINDERGHLAGDRVLAETARRLRRCLRPGDTVARFGGDEFVVLVDDVHTDSAALRVAERIVASLEEPVVVNGEPIPVSGSVGFAFGTSDHCSAEQIIEEADAAMYLAKRSEDHISIYLPRATRSAPEDIERVDRVLLALERGELRLHYHPIYAAGDGSIVAMEALLRWNHPEDGLIAAEAFLREPAVDGVAEAIEAWVIRCACADVVRWKAAGLKVPVRVNVSLHALVGRRLEDRIASEVEATGLATSDLGFEVTMDVAGLDGDAIVERLKRIRALGHSLTIEGFGGANAPMEIISAMPFDVYKLGRGMAAEIDQATDQSETLRRLVAIGRALGGHVVAQGVETEQQHETFKRVGVDALQGYLFSRPKPLDEILASFAGRQPAQKGKADAARPMKARPSGASR
mgnify:CR=1 FL=1